MYELQQKIEELFQSADYHNYDSLDLGCTLLTAMSEEEKDDLSAMIDCLEDSGVEPGQIAFNVIHDLSGCKARHFHLPRGDCFLPRSHGYTKRVS